ncbi:MAG TPA: hypothetical protein VLA42_18255 [Verrucomicrobiae bacterium]|nr:hypothetical protein [Verrucomicrobiae bacterium]
MEPTADLTIPDVAIELPEEVLPAPVSRPRAAIQPDHDQALLAKIAACPCPNKLNFAFGGLLLAKKFHNPAIGAELWDEALQVLFKAAVAIGSQKRWTHPDGVTEIKKASGTFRTCKHEWESMAWECLSERLEKYAQLTEDEILQNIQGKPTRGLARFWAWRWLFERMITAFRRNAAERNRQVKLYYAKRSDRRRSAVKAGQFKEEDDDSLLSLYDRSENTNESDIGHTSEETETTNFDAIDTQLQVDAECAYEETQSAVDELAPGHQRLANAAKRDIIRHVNPDLQAFLDRLIRDANFRSSVFGSDLEEPTPGLEPAGQKPKLAKDYDRELPHIAAQVLRQYARMHGISERTAQRTMQAIRALRDKRKRLKNILS